MVFSTRLAYALVCFGTVTKLLCPVPALAAVPAAAANKQTPSQTHSAAAAGPVHVDSNDSSMFPLNTVGQLANGCTGFLIGPCHVMTVAHCVYEPWKHIWWHGLDFYPGRNVWLNDSSSGWSPLGVATKKDVVLHPNWTSSSRGNKPGQPAADAAIIITNQPVGKWLGWLQHSLPADIAAAATTQNATTAAANNNHQQLQQDVLQDGNSVPSQQNLDRLTADEGMHLHIAGYPDNKPNGSMWQQCCQALDWQLQGSLLWHSCYVRGGNSGSPVWIVWPPVAQKGTNVSMTSSATEQHSSSHHGSSSIWAANGKRRLSATGCNNATKQQRGCFSSSSSNNIMQQQHDSSTVFSRVQVIAVHTSSLKIPKGDGLAAYAKAAYATAIAAAADGSNIVGCSAISSGSVQQNTAQSDAAAGSTAGVPVQSDTAKVTSPMLVTALPVSIVADTRPSSTHSSSGSSASQRALLAGAGGHEDDGENVLLPVAVPFTGDSYRWILKVLDEHQCTDG